MNLRYTDDTLTAESEGLKSLLMKAKEESEKLAYNSTFKTLRLWHLVPSLMANRWGKLGTDFIFLGSKITVDGNCSLEIKRCLLLERKVMTNLDRVLKAET